MLFVPDDLADAVRLDKSADGILYADDISAHCRFDLTVFKRKVAALGGTILKDKTFAIAEWLGALDMTTNESQIFRIPAEVFALDNTIVNGDVFRVPKGILGLEMRVSDLDVLDVLEGILTRHGQVVDLHIFALKEGVHRFQLDTGYLYILASPTKFLAVDIGF